MRSRFALGATAALTAVLLTGCNMPGTAATVNGERITTSELSEAVEAYRGIIPESQATDAQLTGASLSLLLMEDFILDAAAENNLAMSDQELLDAYNFTRINMVGAEPISAEDLSEGQLQFVRAIAYMGPLQQSPAMNEVLQAVQNADIEINPRYGSLNEDSLLEPPSYPWIAQPSLEVLPG